MGTELFRRVRRWFGARRQASPLDRVFADYGRPDEHRDPFQRRPRRELLHPLQGWREESSDRTPRYRNPSRTRRQPPISWSAGN